MAVVTPTAWAALLGDRPAPRFELERPIPARSAAAFMATYRHAWELAAGDPTPLVATTAQWLLLASILAAFPHTFADEPPAHDRTDAHPDALRRAIAFMEENADRPITLADIAVAARVSTRAVSHAFRRHLDTTPGTHLREIRLQRAREELLSTDPSTATAQTIAARWGFAEGDLFGQDLRRSIRP